jgi:hypothetical protein
MGKEARENQKLGTAIGKDGNPDLTGGTIEGWAPDARVSLNDQIREAVGDFRTEEEFYAVRKMINERTWLADIVQVVEDIRENNG